MRLDAFVLSGQRSSLSGEKPSLSKKNLVYLIVVIFACHRLNYISPSNLRSLLLFLSLQLRDLCPYASIQGLL